MTAMIAMMKIVVVIVLPLSLVVSCTCIIPSEWYLVKPIRRSIVMNPLSGFGLDNRLGNRLGGFGFVFVILHCVYPFEVLVVCFLYPHYTYIIGIIQAQSPL